MKLIYALGFFFFLTFCVVFVNGLVEITPVQQQKLSEIQKICSAEIYRDFYDCWVAASENEQSYRSTFENTCFQMLNIPCFESLLQQQGYQIPSYSLIRCTTQRSRCGTSCPHMDVACLQTCDREESMCRNTANLNRNNLRSLTIATITQDNSNTGGDREDDSSTNDRDNLDTESDRVNDPSANDRDNSNTTSHQISQIYKEGVLLQDFLDNTPNPSTHTFLVGHDVSQIKFELGGSEYFFNDVFDRISNSIRDCENFIFSDLPTFSGDVYHYAREIRVSESQNLQQWLEAKINSYNRADCLSVEPQITQRWIQTNEDGICQNVCSDAGGTYLNRCASGENRPPNSGLDFIYGTWGNGAQQLSAGVEIIPRKSGRGKFRKVRSYCYDNGQRRDWDRTDILVGCLCEFRS